MLPPEYVGAIMTGNGLSGIIAGLLKTVMLLTIADLYTQAVIIFVLIFAFFVSCACAYQYVKNSEFYLHYKRISGSDDREP